MVNQLMHIHIHMIDDKLIWVIYMMYLAGEEPYNMKRFWRFLLRKSLPSDSVITSNM